MLPRAVTRFESIGPEHSRAALDFCREQPGHAVFMAGWIADGGLLGNPAVPRGWLMAERARDGRIVGLCYLSATGILMPVMGSERESLEHLAGLARSNPSLTRVVVGERKLVASLWPRLAHAGMSARLSRDQLVYELTRARFSPASEPLPLVEARAPQLRELVAASAAMAREEAHDDPQARNPALFEERIRTRAARGRDFVHLEAGRLVFKANVSAISEVGGQIEGVYTIPERRRRGLGRRGTSAIAAWILEQCPRAYLLVNDDNAPARALYGSLGFEALAPSRTIFLAP